MFSVIPEPGNPSNAYLQRIKLILGDITKQDTDAIVSVLPQNLGDGRRPLWDYTRVAVVACSQFGDDASAGDLVVASGEQGCARGIFVANGRIADIRTLGSSVEVDAGLAAAERPGPEDIDELLLIGTFLRRPPPELRVAPLEREAILKQLAALPRALAAAPGRPARARAA